MFKPTLSTISFRKLRNQLREKVGLKALLDSSQPDVPECLEIPRFGCLPKPLQKRTVWWSFSILFCVLWGGVHKASNVRKCRSKHIQLYRLENVGLKAFLRSRQPVVPGCMFVWCSFFFKINRCVNRYHPIRTGRFIQGGNPHRGPNDATRTRRCTKLNHWSCLLCFVFCF